MSTDKSIIELTMHLEGLTSDRGDMLASVYANKIVDFRLLFDEAQRCYSKSGVIDELLISNLTHNSPTATTYRTTGDCGLKAFEMIVTTIEEVNNKIYKLNSDHFEYFTKLREFCKNNFIKINQMWFSSTNRHLVKVTPDTIEEMDSLLLPDSVSYGSIKGKILRYSGDTKEKYFLIYPSIGGKVKCIFDDDKRGVASKAVEKNAIISGKLKYHCGEFIPFEIDVYHIEVLKPDEELAKLSDILLNDTGLNGDSVQIIKDIRREWK